MKFWNLKLKMKTREIELKFPVKPDFTLGVEALLQKNHYFTPNSNLSVRTRFTQGSSAELIAKKGADPVNGTDRIEYTISTNSTIESLDLFVQDIMGLPVWAKWVRERQQIELKGFNLCFDLNSGYGPILEIEGVDENDIISFASTELGLNYSLTKEDLKTFTSEYVASWEDYYSSFLKGDYKILNSRKELDNRIFN